MICLVSSQLQAEVSLHRGADIGRPCGINTPAAIIVLVLQNVIGGLCKPLLIAAAEKGVQQNVIRLKGGIGFQFAAPVATFALLRKQPLACSVDTCRHAA